MSEKKKASENEENEKKETAAKKQKSEQPAAKKQKSVERTNSDPDDTDEEIDWELKAFFHLEKLEQEKDKKRGGRPSGEEIPYRRAAKRRKALVAVKVGRVLVAASSGF